MNLLVPTALLLSRCPVLVTRLVGDPLVIRWTQDLVLLWVCLKVVRRWCVTLGLCMTMQVSVARKGSVTRLTTYSIPVKLLTLGL